MPTRLPGARMTSAQYHGKREAERFRAWEQHFDQRGWLPRAYDYTGDEPPYGISFAEARERAKAVKAAAPGLRTLLTTTIQASDEHGLTEDLDLMVPVVNHIDGTEAPYAGNQRRSYDRFLQQPGKELWVYQSCMSHGCAFGSNMPENKPGAGWPSYMVDASAGRNRAMQWALFLLEVHGELYYETALALDTAWSDVHRFNGNGDGTLFYPGLPQRIGGTSSVPLPSIRLKHLRQGMQDYEWLKKVADAGDPAFARQLAKSLIPASHQVGDDGPAFDRARTQLVNRWLELQPAQQPGHDPAQALRLANPRGPPGAVQDPTGGGDRAGGGVGCAAVGAQAAGGMGLLGAALLGLRRRR